MFPWSCVFLTLLKSDDLFEETHKFCSVYQDAWNGSKMCHVITFAADPEVLHIDKHHFRSLVALSTLAWQSEERRSSLTSAVRKGVM